MSLNGSFNMTADGPTVKFMGFDINGKPQNQLMRVKTPEVAIALKDRIMKEVEDIKRG